MAAIVVGWPLAQSPDFLPGLTLDEAAASDATLWALLISVAVGLVVLVPSLVYLFRLQLSGRFQQPPDTGAEAPMEPGFFRVPPTLVVGAPCVIGPAT